MKKLWVFGDSFAASKKYTWSSELTVTPDDLINGCDKRIWDRDNPKDYKEHLAVKLGVDFISDSPWTAIMGVSDEFMVSVVVKFQGLIQPDDYVLYVSTDPLREFIIPDIPNHGNIVNFHMKSFRESLKSKAPKKVLPKLDKQFQIAMDYADYIQSMPEKLSALLITFQARMTFLNKIFSIVVGKNYLIIPGMSFYDINKQMKVGFSTNDIPTWDKSFPANDDLLVRGCMGIPSFMEMEDPTEYNKIMNNQLCWNGVDARRNHLSIANHPIMADKIYESMVNKTDLDLNTGFKSGFLNARNCKSIGETVWEVGNEGGYISDHS